MVNFTRITPNIISLLSLLFGLASAYAYFYGYVLFGGILYFISYIFDATDGKVARIKKTGKVYGAWMDLFIDRVNLVLISTAISYNYFATTNNVSLIFINSVFLGIVFIGSESRYNIDLFKLKHNMNDLKVDLKKSKYLKWCENQGLIKYPISLPELFLFYLIFAPYLKIEYPSLIFISFFLIGRIVMQQKFWIDVIKNK